MSRRSSKKLDENTEPVDDSSRFKTGKEQGEVGDERMKRTNNHTCGIKVKE
jgi:hypothetical protein